MKTFSFMVTMKVADSWIADGFQVKDRLEDIEDKIAELLPYAYGHECIVKARIVSHPSDEIITALQNGELEAKD